MATSTDTFLKSATWKLPAASRSKKSIKHSMPEFLSISSTAGAGMTAA
jgi:hypothetical protein